MGYQEVAGHSYRGIQSHNNSIVTVRNDVGKIIGYQEVAWHSYRGIYVTDRIIEEVSWAIRRLLGIVIEVFRVLTTLRRLVRRIMGKQWAAGHSYRVIQSHDNSIVTDRNDVGSIMGYHGPIGGCWA